MTWYQSVTLIDTKNYFKIKQTPSFNSGAYEKTSFTQHSVNVLTGLLYVYTLQHDTDTHLIYKEMIASCYHIYTLDADLYVTAWIIFLLTFRSVICKIYALQNISFSFH